MFLHNKVAITLWKIGEETDTGSQTCRRWAISKLGADKSGEN